MEDVIPLHTAHNVLEEILTDTLIPMDIDPELSQKVALNTVGNNDKDHYIHSSRREWELLPSESSPLLNLWKDLWDLNGDISMPDANSNAGVVNFRTESVAHVIVDPSRHISNDSDMEIDNLADSLSNVAITQTVEQEFISPEKFFLLKTTFFPMIL